MKQVNRFAIVVWIGVLSASFYAQDQRSPQPALSGEKAVSQLKSSGQYDGLKRAFDAARSRNGKVGATPSADAVGTTAKVTASNGTSNDYFGNGVAIQGDLAVVGAPADDNLDKGSAYVFQQIGTVWSEQAVLTASDGAIGDLFGWSVAISGDTVIVGAYGVSGGRGAAYIFVQNGTAWNEQAKLTASLGAPGDNLGTSVGIFGDTAVVGANFNDVPNADQGSVYIFERTGLNWNQTQKLNASDGAVGDQFGFSLAISGNTIIVGASTDDVGSNADQGSAYVFVYSGSMWTEQAKLTATTGAAAYDNFGSSVALSGDTAIIGAPSDGIALDPGSAYIFTRSGTTWTQQAQLLASDGAAKDLFGSSVGISGDKAIIGAWGVDGVGGSLAGSAYVFERAGAVWTQTARLSVDENGGDDFFGYSVAISGNNIIVGTPLDDIGPNTDQGSAFIFRVLGPGWSQESQKVASDGTAGDSFGISVAISGDTAIVGASTDDVGANVDQGSAYIFVRTSTGWAEQAHLFAGDGAAGDQFGISVAISGDTAVVGAAGDDVGANADQGSAYVFARTGTTWAQQDQLIDTAGGTNIGDGFGISVAVSGDTAIAGAYRYDLSPNGNQGVFVVFSRESGVWQQKAKVPAAGGAADDQFGISVAYSGNTVVVGANKADVGGNADQGSAYVFTGLGGNWTQQAQLNGTGGAASDEFGVSVGISGDTAIVGANKTNAAQGSAYVFTRSGGVWTQQAQLTATGGAGGDEFGTSVSIAGDAAVVGAPKDDVGPNSDQGSAYVFIRSGAAWTQQAQLNGAGGAANDEFGRSVALGGDKVAAGAPLSDASVSVPLAPQAANQGSAFFFGNSFLPTAAPVSIGGRVLAPGGYGLRNAIVNLTLASGETRRTISSSFGYFRFDGIEAGQTVVVSIASKRFQFGPQIVSLGEDVTDLTFTPQ